MRQEVVREEFVQQAVQRQEVVRQEVVRHVLARQQELLDQGREREVVHALFPGYADVRVPAQRLRVRAQRLRVPAQRLRVQSLDLFLQNHLYFCEDLREDVEEMAQLLQQVMPEQE